MKPKYKYHKNWLLNQTFLLAEGFFFFKYVSLPASVIHTNTHTYTQMSHCSSEARLVCLIKVKLRECPYSAYCSVAQFSMKLWAPASLFTSSSVWTLSFINLFRKSKLPPQHLFFMLPSMSLCIGAACSWIYTAPFFFGFRSLRVIIVIKNCDL